MSEALTRSARQSRLPLAPRGLSRVEAATYIGVSPVTWDRMVDDGRMPKPKEIERRKVWDRYEVDTAFDALPDSEENEWDRG